MFLGLNVSIGFAPGLVACLANFTTPYRPSINEHLGPWLSQEASIAHGATVSRWSEFGAPDLGTVVNVATEKDVLQTVRYCIANNITFLTQSGGNGWAKTFKCSSDGVLINLKGLKGIDFCESKTEVTIGGGVIVRDLLRTAYTNDVQVSIGNCNCNGVLGAILGGSFSRLMGWYGFGVDNVISMNLVTPQGQLITVDGTKRDLWFALRGAGANFGIVTSAILKAYTMPRGQSGAWLGPLIFTEDKIELLVQAINDIELNDSMSVFLYYAAKPPKYEPLVIALPFYLNAYGQQGRKAFSSIFDLDPVMDGTGWVPYNQINDESEPICVKGGRKPTFGVGLGHLDPQTWRVIWEEYKEFLKIPGTQNSIVLTERYPLRRARTYGDASSAYPFRSSLRFNAAATLAYDDPALDTKATAFGSRMRDLWRSTAGLPCNQTYINYAFGDEDRETVYGQHLGRLQKLKRQYDPEGRFNQWFPLS